MRRMIVTKKNKNSFTTFSITHVLEAIDKLLYDKDLELVIGDDGCDSDYTIRIDRCRVDEEYDEDRAHTVIYGRGKGICDKFEI